MTWLLAATALRLALQGLPSSHDSDPPTAFRWRAYLADHCSACPACCIPPEAHP